MLRKFCSYLTLFFLIILGAYRGYIAIWTTNTAAPTKVFPYSIQSLPKVDQEKLEKGIEINSWEELYQLLQDYLS